jgi:hypothetical protein
MKRILATLIAVSVLGLAAVPASAFDARQFYHDRDTAGIN